MHSRRSIIQCCTGFTDAANAAGGESAILVPVPEAQKPLEAVLESLDNLAGYGQKMKL